MKSLSALRRTYSVPVGLDASHLNLRESLRKQVQLSGLHTDRQLDPINWDKILEEEGFVDDSCKHGDVSEEEDSGQHNKFYHSPLKEKYGLIERRDGVKVCDVFAAQSISSIQDQEYLLILWDSSHEFHHMGLRRGEELFHFVDQEEFGQDAFEKFVAFHLDATGGNQFGEVTFDNFVLTYQLIEAQYRSPQSILGRLFQHPLDVPQTEDESEDETTKDMDWHQYRLELLHRCSYVTVREHQLLFEQDKELTHIYFVFQGSVQIFRKTKEGDSQIIGTVGNGGNYGIMEFISGQNLLLNGIATTKTHAIKLPVDGFAKLLSRDWRFTWMILASTLMNISKIQTVFTSEALTLRTPPPTGVLKASTDLASPTRTFSSSSNLGTIIRRKKSEPAVNEILPLTFSKNQTLVQRILELLRTDTTGDFTMKTLKLGEFVYRAGDASDSMYILISGVAGRILRLEFDKEVKILPGEVIGETGFFCRMDRTTDIRCLTRCQVVQITKAGVLQLAKENSRHLDSFLTQTIEGIFEHIKSLKNAYKYFTVRNGEHLLKPGAQADSFFFLINGRLREHQGNLEMKKKVNEWCNVGSCIGLRELLLEQHYTSYITAIKDSELVQFDKVWVTQLMSTNPTGFQNLMKTALNSNSKKEQTNKKLIGIVPLSVNVPIYGFICNLIKVLKKHGTIKMVTEVLIRQRFGLLNTLSTSTTAQNVWNFLTALHHKFDFVICIGKPNMSPWTRWMLQHVDLTLIVAHSNHPAKELTDWESGLNFYNSHTYLTEKRLVVLHPPRVEISGTKDNFLRARQEGTGKVFFHHHIAEGDRLQYDSLGRFITGNAVGLVLGGGGARGMAHIGAVKALRQAGIPIDMVGGVSMGSQVGGLVAANISLESVSQRLYKVYVVNLLVDLTFPFLSLLSGRVFCTRLAKYLGMDDKQIEDLPLPFFCLSCNLSHLTEYIHTDGTMWNAMRASSSLPIIFPPVVSEAGDLLVDGGYVNNLPVDIMREMFGANYIIAVDVGDYSKMFCTGYRDFISGWSVLFNSVLGRGQFPTVYEVLLQLGGVVDWNKQEKRPKYFDIRISPSLKGVNSWQDFPLHDSLIERGFESAKTTLSKIKKDNPLLWSAIFSKVEYPPEMVEGPKPNPPRRVSWREYIFQPKLLVLLLVGWGVFRVAVWILVILRAFKGQIDVLSGWAYESLRRNLGGVTFV